MVYCWWSRIETWLNIHNPNILQSLNPPVDERYLENCGDMPRYLKLLYRFHDGQQYPCQGLLGGYEFYDVSVSMALTSSSYRTENRFENSTFADNCLISIPHYFVCRPSNDPTSLLDNVFLGEFLPYLQRRCLKRFERSNKPAGYSH